MVYTVFQCSICRRLKDIPQDQRRAVPNGCTITKGCSGFLFATGETTVFTPTPPVEGLTDWYPRNQKPTVSPVAVANKTVSLSSSSIGVLTLGLSLPGSVSSPPPSTVVVSLSQQLTQDISYNEFIYKIGTASSTVISGQDSTGKNLRFSTSSVTNGLVFVLVNGVASFPGQGSSGWTASGNSIEFNTPLAKGTLVTVTVYSQPPTFTIRLKFSLNQNLTLNENSGAWGNVRWIEEFDAATGNLKQNKWWLYSCSGTDILSKSSRLSFTGIFKNSSATLDPAADTALDTSPDFSGIRFLLSSPPYENVDRYLNFYIDGAALGNEYALLTSTATITELFAESSALVEIYPPFQLVENPAAPGLSSFITEDTFSSSSTASASSLTGTKTLGPI